MAEPATKIIGLQPWLPGPLAASDWWTQPVRAERLAALRIGLGLALLLDIFTTYWPWLSDFYGPGSLAGPDVLLDPTDRSIWPFTLLNGLSAASWQIVFLAAALAASLLTIGCCTRLATIAAWLLMGNIYRQGIHYHCGGDDVRSILLFLLMFCPAGAAWSTDAWWRRRQLGQPDGPVFVYPWMLRLLFVQLAIIYFMTGAFKLLGSAWLDGTASYYALANGNWSRISFTQLPVPDWATRFGTWFVIAWELSFPVLVCWRRTRLPMLSLGVLFHVVTAVTMRVSTFPVYMLCLYLPLVPWERLLARRASEGYRGSGC